MGHGSSHHQNEAYGGFRDRAALHMFRNRRRRLNRPALPPPPSGPTTAATVVRIPDRGNRLEQGNPQPNRISQRQLIRDREQLSAHPGILPSIRPSKYDAILSKPRLDQETLEKYSWNFDDSSLNIYDKEDDPLTFHRHPIADSTDCIRGKVGFNRGFHVWKITWPEIMRGTNAVIGVGTKDAPLEEIGYSSMVGSNAESYGWDLNRNLCGFNARNDSLWRYPITVPAEGGHFFAPDHIWCILDMDEGNMSFATHDQYLGVAFRGLKGKTLYPMVSCVWGDCEVTLKYYGGIDPEPLQLMEICRNTILQSLKKESVESVHRLPLPRSMKKFLLYKSR